MQLGFIKLINGDVENLRLYSKARDRFIKKYRSIPCVITLDNIKELFERWIRPKGEEDVVRADMEYIKSYLIGICPEIETLPFEEITDFFWTWKKIRKFFIKKRSR